MKYIMVIPDGLTDLRIKKYNNKTPLDSANIPAIDYLLQNGMTGTVQTIPDGCPPGSDIAQLSLLGVNPRKVKLGRGAIEALANNIKVNDGETVFRTNFVTIENQIMKDYSGGGIHTKDSKEMIKQLNQEFDENVRFFAGVGYRNIAVINKKNIKIKTTPPHDITDKKINSYVPKGQSGDFINSIMTKAHEVIINSNYFKKNKLKANNIWLWGEGKVSNGVSFEKSYNLKGAVISAVDIIKGIAKYLSLDVIKVPGITGEFNTNYGNKFKYALKNINKYDFIYIHIEAPDEAGHQGNFNEKKSAIEKIDKMIIKPLLESKEKFNIIVVPDHPTPLKYRTHTNEKVPFILYSKYKNIKSNHNFSHYCEDIVKKSPLHLNTGHNFLKWCFSEFKKLN
ncbi:MAG: cofactor-independent phosphoglycerate mutase [Spirochaetia bacterium]|nr:cofactor-independent phosphoglycerate mutase [Spirochaetia bacterium]